MNYPHFWVRREYPIAISVRRARPRHMKMFPGGGSLALERYPPNFAIRVMKWAIDGRDNSVGAADFASASNRSSSSCIKARVGSAFGSFLLIIVIPKMRHARKQQVAIEFTKRGAVRSFDCSTLQPDFRILWKSSIFQRIAYHFSFSAASARLRTGKSVRCFHSIRSRFFGVSRSVAWITVKESGPQSLAFATGANTNIHLYRTCRRPSGLDPVSPLKN